MTDRKWRIVIDVDGTQETIKFEAAPGEEPTVQEALAALKLAMDQVNSLRIPVTQSETKGDDAQ